MSLASQLLNKIADPTVGHNERARLRCQLAKELERSGNYEGARGAMGELWSRVGERPVLDDLDRATTAEVLLRAGALTGYIGSAKQIVDAQETAKNLISESITTFEALEDKEKVAEAQSDLAYCYWREGAFDEARALLQDALIRLPDTDHELKAIALLRTAIVEASSNRFNDALRIHTKVAPLFEESGNHSLKGRFHSEFAIVLETLAISEKREDYTNRALIEFAAASFHFEQAGQSRHCACVENNLGMLFSVVGKFPEAHEHLDRAQAIFTSLKDSVHLAQVDETRARVLLAGGHAAEAEKLVRSAVRTLEKGGEQSLLAEALTTHGTALARTGQHQQARLTLERAVEVAGQAGDLRGAGQAALTIIEELAERLAADDLVSTYEHAADLLENSQHPGLLNRLCSCARRVVYLVTAHPAPVDWEGFSFKDAVHRYEARLIERALKDAGGAVTRAAYLLGFDHHQSLASLLNTRHQNLLDARIPAVPRRRSIVTVPDTRRRSRRTASKETQPISILHVEDDRQVANTVKDTLELEGWKVETCADGANALTKIESHAHYDMLLVDNDLPGMNGVELVRRARELVHRQRVPVIMLSASDCEQEALRAGANAFLRKPEDLLALVEIIARMLIIKTQRHQ